MDNARAILEQLGISQLNSGVYADGWVAAPGGQDLTSSSPVDGSPLARVKMGSTADYERVAATAVDAFKRWRLTPAPQRGEIVRQIGEELRANKAPLGQLVTLEMGKLLAEGLGEVQEMIDICDFAVGLSRQLYGRSMHSERPSHRMYEQWHPLGPTGVITAFNFPVAVWAWNAAIATVCGNPVIWKPSPKTPLCAIAVQQIVNRVLERNDAPPILSLIVGEVDEVGTPLVDDGRVPLISATGSTVMGRHVAQRVAARLGRTLLELGGNNALVVTADANLELTLRAILFGAVGTAGQRCTTTRRLLVERPIADELAQRLVEAYGQVRVGDPLDPHTLMGPLIDAQAVEAFERAIDTIKVQGGKILCGGKRAQGKPSPYYVEPTIVRATPTMPIIKQETFAPILYVIEGEDLEQLIGLHNDVAQGLSSALFTTRLQQAEQFLCAAGSDCGIANINIGTSGAEIGGAFGGEKETGGGREAGSDAWKAYMRRQTVTINYSNDLPLAQGIRFGDS